MVSSNKLLNASFWVFFTYGASQIIRFGSSLITTRLVSPDLMGIIAVVMLVIGGVEMFCDTGFWAYVVRHKTPEDPTMLNTVWTLQVIRGWIVFVLVLVISYILYQLQFNAPERLGGVYNQDNLPFLIAFAGTSAIFSGFKSLASPIFSSKMERKKLELFDLLIHFIVAIITITWLYFNPSVWVLVACNVIGTVLHLFVSFKFYPVRHQLMLSTDVVKDVFMFSRWIVLSSAMTYLFMQGDRLFLAYKISPTELGLYAIALTLMGVFMTIPENFSVKILFPYFSRIVNERPEQLKSYFNKYKTYITLLAILLSFTLYSISTIIFGTIYDERYSEAAWMFQILLVSFIGVSVSAVSMECLSALSQTKIRTTVMFVRVIILFLSLPLSYAYFGFYGTVWAIALNVWVGVPVVYYGLVKHKIYSYQADLILILAVIVFLSMLFAGLL
jgi:O-antigen/teichoic acid export membrane protein